MTKMIEIDVAVIVPLWTAGRPEIAEGLADFVSTCREVTPKLQIIDVALNELDELDIATHEAVITWLPEGTSVGLGKMAVHWSMFSCFTEMHGKRLLAQLNQFRERLELPKLAFVSDASMWGRSSVLHTTAKLGDSEPMVLDGDHRQHNRYLRRKGLDSNLAEWVRSKSDSLIVCPDSYSAQLYLTLLPKL